MSAVVADVKSCWPTALVTGVRLHWWKIGAAVLLVGAAFWLGCYLPITRDEIWHWPAALLFGGGLPDIKTLACYYSGPGPLSYIIWGNLHALGAGLPVLRALSMVCVLITTVGLARLGKALDAASLPIVVAFILLQPYVFINGFFLMTDALSMALAVWASYWICTAVKTSDRRYWLLAAVATAAVLYTRFPYLCIPFGVGFSGLLDRRNRSGLMGTAVVSLLSVGPLVALWGGFATLTRQMPSLRPGLYPHNINHELAWLGFFFWPYLFTRLQWAKETPRFLWVIPFIGLACLPFGYVPFSRAPGCGVIDHLFVLTGEIGPKWSPYVFYIVCGAIGLAVVTHVAFRAWHDPVRRTVLFIALCAAAIPGISPAWSERHAIPAYLFMGILAWSEPFRRRWLIIAWLVFMGILSCTHLWHIVMDVLWQIRWI